MKARKPLLIAGVALVLAGVTFAGWSWLSGLEPAPLPQAEWSTTPSPKPKSSNGPVTPDNMKASRLLVPELDIYAQVVDEPVRGGMLELPYHTRVARYSGGGTVTGQTGTLLISGHVSSYGEPGALKKLSQIEPGDWFYVTDEAGNRADFIATGMSVKDKSDLPEDVFDATGPRRAVLVTCGGSVETRADGSRHYTKNVIVYGTEIDAVAEQAR